MRYLFLSIILLINLYSENSYLESISYLKIKKQVDIEEEIAYLYKEYIRKNASIPTLENLGINKLSAFNTQIILENNYIKVNLTNIINSKTNLYDFYISKQNRKYTKPPLNINNNKVKIILSSKEKYFLKYRDRITRQKSEVRNKYYLDEKGILHFYDESREYKYSFDGKKLIVDSSIGPIPEVGEFSISKINNPYYKFFSSLNLEVLRTGQKTYTNSATSTSLEYIYLGNERGYTKLSKKNTNPKKAKILLSKTSGGMLVNEEIYVWGNNANRILGLKNPKITKYISINTPVRLKSNLYTNLENGKNLIKDYNYFSSPFRPKFVDFYTNTDNGTCGITQKGELFCTGLTSNKYSFGFNYTDLEVPPSGIKKEMLYRSNFFNGEDIKVKKIFVNNQLWTILSQNGDIYSWGFDYNGFSGKGLKKFNYSPFRDENKKPELININDNNKVIKIKDIVNIPNKKIAALSITGNIFTWGWGGYSISDNCIYEGKSLCRPLKIDNIDINFISIKAGVESFIAKDDKGDFYRIYDSKSLMKVLNLNQIIKKRLDYSIDNDSKIILIDVLGDKIVWINGYNEIKGDFSNNENVKNIVKRIKWKSLKIVDNNMGICGIDINNQMYCWNIKSYYRQGDSSNFRDSFLLPIFNTNNTSSLVEETSYYSKNSVSEKKELDNKSEVFLMNPTYIGGLNYDFEFK